MQEIITGSAAGLGLIAVFAAVLGILSRKTRQPTVIAYIATGLILGTTGFGLVENSSFLELMSELGLGFLLFFIGLEINLDEVREILKPVTVIALLQMALVGVVSFLLTTGLGFSYFQSLVIAGATIYGSTAVVVKMLADKDQESTLPGKLDVGMLLIEDIVVVILMALLSAGGGTPAEIALKVGEIGVFVGIITGVSFLASRYFLPNLFETLESNGHAFFIYGMGWFFAMVTFAQEIGMSLEIGAFFAGLSLAQIPYSIELRERVRPLTDFFMAMFFVTLGLDLTPDILGTYMVQAVIASGVLMVAKFVIIFLLTDSQKFTPETSFKTALNKTQISEFALIFGSVAVSQGLIGEGVLGFLSITAILTMGASSYLITFNDELYRYSKSFLQKFESEEKKDVDIDRLEGHAVVIGYDELARRSAEALLQHYERVVVVDNEPGDADHLGESDFEYIYGDFAHGEIREAASLDNADFVLSILPDFELNKKVLEDIGEDATSFVRAKRVEEAAELYDLDAHYVIIKNILAGDRMSEYIKLYLEDRELFLEEVKEENEILRWGGRSV